MTIVIVKVSSSILTLIYYSYYCSYFGFYLCNSNTIFVFFDSLIIILVGRRLILQVFKVPSFLLLTSNY